MKLKQEVEQTFEPELSTFASCMALKCADPEGQHFTVHTAPLQRGGTELTQAAATDQLVSYSNLCAML